jgi:hypothetical protein
MVLISMMISILSKRLSVCVVADIAVVGSIRVCYPFLARKYSILIDDPFWIILEKFLFRSSL